MVKNFQHIYSCWFFIKICSTQISWNLSNYNLVYNFQHSCWFVRIVLDCKAVSRSHSVPFETPLAIGVFHCCGKPWDSVGHRGEWATSSSQLWFSSCGINQVKKSTKLTVYGLGSETVCPEKNRQTAFNSPLFCPISPHLYLIDDQCACIFSENWPGPIHAISSYQRTIGCFILLVPLQKSASR